MNLYNKNIYYRTSILISQWHNKNGGAESWLKNYKFLKWKQVDNLASTNVTWNYVHGLVEIAIKGGTLESRPFLHPKSLQSTILSLIPNICLYKYVFHSRFSELILPPLSGWVRHPPHIHNHSWQSNFNYFP